MDLSRPNARLAEVAHHGRVRFLPDPARQAEVEPLAGFFAAEEIGPIAGCSALHGFTESMALFIKTQDEPRPARGS
ncbi:hypothetical protein A5764_17120 [Mycobacterium sp. 852002-51057_SCH5723018]|nr:hypothetical protein A5764_17120 [Mycobacterium sp. 852002-51057_SCH5723018]